MNPRAIRIVPKLSKPAFPQSEEEKAAKVAHDAVIAQFKQRHPFRVGVDLASPENPTTKP